MLMFSNNKNKKSKELTLQEIIQKSSFRKTIDNLCLIQKKINKQPIKFSTLSHTPVESINTTSRQLKRFQYFGSKNSYESNKDIEKLHKNSITARTSKSQKSIPPKFMILQQDRVNNFHTISPNQQQQKNALNQRVKKSDKIKVKSLQRNGSLKNKNYKMVDYLCVKGASGNINNCQKPHTAIDTKRGLIPQYQIKKYQTVVELGQQIPNIQLKQKVISSQQDMDMKKFHSFVLTKYTVSNNLRARTSSNKSYSHTKIKPLVLMPQQLIQRKIDYNGAKTQQKQKLQITENQFLQKSKSKQMKKYELILNVNDDEQNKQIKNKNYLKKLSENIDNTNVIPAVNNNEIIFQQKFIKGISPQKKQNQQINSNLNMTTTNTKGFKGNKIKTLQSNNFMKTKTKYFIPDFIKPSLELVAFEKKPEKEKLKTQDRFDQNIQNCNLGEQHLGKGGEQILGQFVKGTKFTLQLKSCQQLLQKSPYIDQQQFENQQNQKSFMQNQEKQNKFHNTDSQVDDQQKYEKRKNNKNNKKPKKNKLIHVQPEISAWGQNQSLRNIKKLKNNYKMKLQSINNNFHENNDFVQEFNF